MEEMKADMQHMKTNMNNFNASTSMPFRGGTKHDSTVFAASSSDDVVYGAHVRTDKSYPSQQPSRMAKRDLHVSTSPLPPFPHRRGGASSPARRSNVKDEHQPQQKMGARKCRIF
jgi:hypothetical protein